jgi:predicted amidophosphoribosyltransferase
MLAEKWTIIDLVGTDDPIVCPYCATVNPPEQKDCQSCGAPLPVQLPRVCPKCGRAHTSAALFCQSCGTRLVEG